MHPAQQGYGWPYQPSPPARSRSRPAGGVRHQLVIGGTLLTLALLAGLLRSSRGFVAVGLAWVVVGLLARRRVDGWREWAKAVVEYATVAALAVAVLTAGPAPAERPKPRPPAAKAKAAESDPLEGARAWFAEWRQRLPRVEVSTTTKEAR